MSRVLKISFKEHFLSICYIIYSMNIFIRRHYISLFNYFCHS